MAQSGFDYFGGGGFKAPAGKKSHQEGDKPNALTVIKAAGYVLPDSRQAILDLKPGTKAVAVNPVLDSSKAMPYALDKDAKGLSLAEYTAKGIELLDNPQGFFFMDEGGKIDLGLPRQRRHLGLGRHPGPGRRRHRIPALRGQASPGDLIVVTGDHECGGLTLGFAGTRYGNYYDYLKNQQVSFDAFTDALEAYKKSHTPETATFEDVIPLIKDSFGLIVPTDADLQAMQNTPKPNEDTTTSGRTPRHVPQGLRAGRGQGRLQAQPGIHRQAWRAGLGSGLPGLRRLRTPDRHPDPHPGPESRHRLDQLRPYRRAGRDLGHRPRFRGLCRLLRQHRPGQKAHGRPGRSDAGGQRGGK